MRYFYGAAHEQFPPEHLLTDDWHDPRKMYEHGEETISDDELKQALIISSDAEVHADRIREAEKLGATTMALMNVSGADPHRAIEVYRRQVLPALAKATARYATKGCSWV
jgi:coenzyme F420-dependent glucose-6-phosphate dehydrogenase